MRDEDLKNLPQTIERWRFAEMLEALGFGKDAQNNIRDMSVDREGVHAVVYATDADGKRYFKHTVEQVEVTGPGDTEPVMIDGRTVSEPALHEISIPFVGEWKPLKVSAEPPPGIAHPEGYHRTKDSRDACLLCGPKRPPHPPLDPRDHRQMG
jgi:hypothetical protein